VEAADEVHNGEEDEAHTGEEAADEAHNGRLIIALDGTFPSALQMLKHSELVRFTELKHMLC